jgi:hypothetical protein
MSARLTDVLRIALTAQRRETDGLWTFHGVVINENAAELWHGPSRATRELAQTDANIAAESLTTPAPWAR